MKNTKFRLVIVLAIIAMGLAQTSCKKTETPAPTPFDLATASKGGIMYDKFWSAESGFNLADPNVAKFNAKADFFRCKQCHAWDLKGNAGSYIGRAPNANRPRVSGIDLTEVALNDSPQEIFDFMKDATGKRDISFDLTTYDPTTNFTEGDKMPNYAQLLTDAQIWDLVKYIKTGAFDVTKLYDAVTTGTYPTGTIAYSNIGRDGNAANGKTFFTANCQGCHGVDGKTLALEGLSLGKFLRSKPNEVQHKVHYGQLGSTMTGKFDMTLAQMTDLYKALANATDFPD